MASERPDLRGRDQRPHPNSRRPSQRRPFRENSAKAFHQNVLVLNARLVLDQRGEVVGSLVGGLEKLAASPDRPPHFNDRALQTARRLARRRNGRITDVLPQAGGGQGRRRGFSRLGE